MMLKSSGMSGHVGPPGLDSLRAKAAGALQSGEFEQAIQLYDGLIESRPDDAEAHYKRANALNMLGRFEAALAGYGRAVALKPDYANAFCNRGAVLERLGQWEQALASYDRALDLNPGDALAHYNRGSVLKELDRLDAALASYDRAIGLRPDYLEAHFNRGNVLHALGRYPAAVDSYSRVIDLNPEFAEGFHARGLSLERLRQLPAALADYDRALALRSDLKYLIGLRRHIKMQICDWEDVESDRQLISAGLESGLAVSVPLPVLALFDSPRIHQLVSRVWVREHCPPDDSLGPIAKRSRGARIRVGYFSADFRSHPVSILTAGLFEKHDRSRFEITAFAFGSDAEDPMRVRLKRAFEHFIDVDKQSDADVALLARSLEIDIAVDLGGFTEGARTRIFSRRAAPLQVGYLGYPGTSAAPYMDYLIADHTLIPQDAERHYSEKIIRLPDSYQPNDGTRAVSERLFTRQELGLPARGFVFCCFNRGFKLMPENFDDWMQILNRVEGSVLWLSERDATAVSNLRREAERRGISPERLVIATPMSSMADHLARLRAADLFLDTLPFNAHTTASDALWAGLPVLTCAGNALPGSVAASLLNALRMPELITTTRAQYRDLAVRLAMDPAGLQSLRDNLTRNRLVAPLFDTARYTHHLEAAFTSIYERHQTDQPPAHIAVSPSYH